MNQYLILGIGVIGVIALAAAGIGSVSVVVAQPVPPNCSVTPSGNVEHCIRDDIDQGGGARVETPAGTQAGFGGNNDPFEGCTGGNGFHDGAPYTGPVGSAGEGLQCSP